MTYKKAGVDIDANAVWVRRIQSAMAGTHGPQVLGKAGAFAGMFRLGGGRAGGAESRHPVLVGCADGVGTKVLLGVKAGRLHGLGIDLVAMNVNDLITCGARPLFFLDYLAVHKLDPDALLALIEGVAEGCRQAGCALLGGETAEMPDLYGKGHLDLAGFAVGIVDEDRAIDCSKVAPGDALIGLPSSGIHSNGFSLVRRVIAGRRWPLNRRRSELGETLAEAVLRPTRIYVQPVLTLLQSPRIRPAIRGMAHITGGGLVENLARSLSPKCDAVIDTSSWKPPPIFALLQTGGVPGAEMFSVFNMGIGYVLVVRPDAVEAAVRKLRQLDESPIIIGRVRRGSGKVVLR